MSVTNIHINVLNVTIKLIINFFYWQTEFKKYLILVNFKFNTFLNSDLKLEFEKEFANSFSLSIASQVKTKMLLEWFHYFYSILRYTISPTLHVNVWLDSMTECVTINASISAWLDATCAG